MIVHKVAFVLWMGLQHHRPQDGVGHDDAVAWAQVARSKAEACHAVTAQCGCEGLIPPDKSGKRHRRLAGQAVCENQL